MLFVPTCIVYVLYYAHAARLLSHPAHGCWQAVIPAATLKDFIAYARARCQPELSPDAATDLIQGYCDMRRVGTSRKVRPTAPCG